MLNAVPPHKPLTVPGEGPPSRQRLEAEVPRAIPVAKDGYQGPRTFTGTLRLEKERLLFAPDPEEILPKLTQTLFAEGLSSDLRVQRLGFADLTTLAFTTSATLEAKLVGQDREAVTRAITRLNQVGGGWRVSVFEPAGAQQ